MAVPAATLAAKPTTARLATRQLSLALSVCAAAFGLWAIAIDVGSTVNASPALFVLGCVSIVWAIAGVVITVRHHCPAASMIGGFALALSVAAVSSSVDATKVLTDTNALLTDLGQRLSLTVTPAIAFHLLLTLPDGHVSRPSHRRFVWAGYIAAFVTGLALMVDRDNVLEWPVLLLWAIATLAMPVAHSNYRASGIIDQRRMQWIGWASVVAVEVILVSVALSLVAEWPNHVGEISLAASGLIPIALAAGTLSRLLGRIDRLLTHTVSLAGLSALIVVAYLIALAAFGRRPDDSERSLLLLSMLASAGAAIAHQPARTWLTDRANRVVYGERISPDEALRTWGARLTRAIPLDELLLQLAETLRKSMQLRSAQIWAGTDGHYEIAAMVPHRTMKPYTVGEKERAVVSRAGVSGGTWLDIWLPGLVEKSNSSTRVAPIAHSGELLGLIVCERNADRANFTEEDDRVLTELARQVGLALHNVQLDTALQASLDELRDANDELRASRVRIVAAGDAERRKLERNLHDGAQQHLVALAVKLRLAKDSVVDDPADAEAMIDEIRGDLQEAISELRALAHGIFPPLLMSGGLAEALPAAAARAALPTTTEIVAGRHRQEVEAAVYFCCMEAMQNSGKHAGENATGTIRVWEDEAMLHWEVSDNGPGFDMSSGASSGHGFVNMRDRMGSFGGTIEIVSSVGSGTIVRGQLPLG